jgi:hypothetical protein
MKSGLAINKEGDSVVYSCEVCRANDDSCDQDLDGITDGCDDCNVTRYIHIL